VVRGRVASFLQICFNSASDAEARDADAYLRPTASSQQLVLHYLLMQLSARSAWFYSLRRATSPADSYFCPE
jgi:hypothetical protein